MVLDSRQRWHESNRHLHSSGLMLFRYGVHDSSARAVIAMVPFRVLDCYEVSEGLEVVNFEWRCRRREMLWDGESVEGRHCGLREWCKSSHIGDVEDGSVGGRVMCRKSERR